MRKIIHDVVRLSFWVVIAHFTLGAIAMLLAVMESVSPDDIIDRVPGGMIRIWLSVGLCALLVWVVVWFAMVWHCIDKLRKGLIPVSRTIKWLAVLVVFNWLGAMPYYFLVYRRPKPIA